MCGNHADASSVCHVMRGGQGDRCLWGCTMKRFCKTLPDGTQVIIWNDERNSFGEQIIRVFIKRPGDKKPDSRDFCFDEGEHVTHKEFLKQTWRFE